MKYLLDFSDMMISVIEKHNLFLKKEIDEIKNNVTRKLSNTRYCGEIDRSVMLISRRYCIEAAAKALVEFSLSISEDKNDRMECFSDMVMSVIEKAERDIHVKHKGDNCSLEKTFSLRRVT